jgi:hypothetical protein
VVRDGDILPTAAVRKVLVDCGVPGRPHHFTRLFIGGSLAHAGMAPNLSLTPTRFMRFPRPRGTVIRIGHHIADCPPHWSANDENGGSQGVRVPASFTAASSRDGDGKEEFFLRKMKTIN